MSIRVGVFGVVIISLSLFSTNCFALEEYKAGSVFHHYYHPNTNALNSCDLHVNGVSISWESTNYAVKQVRIRIKGNNGAKRYQDWDSVLYAEFNASSGYSEMIPVSFDIPPGVNEVSDKLPFVLTITFSTNEMVKKESVVKTSFIYDGYYPCGGPSTATPSERSSKVIPNVQ